MTQQIEPCPNCGGACRPCPSKSPWSSKWVECGNTACQYKGPISLTFDAKTDGAFALHNRIARAVREASELSHLAGHYLTRAEKAEAERDALLRHLSTMFDAYENGVECYEDPDEEAGYMGLAFKLPEDEFAAIADILNKLDPRPRNNTP